MQRPTLAGTLRTRRNLSEIVGASFRFYGADWRGFVTIGAGTIPASVGSSLIGGLVEEPALAGALLLPLFLASFAIYALVAAAVISFLLQVDGGKQPDERIALRAAFSRASDLLRATYRSAIISLFFAITVIGLPVAINRVVRWAFVPQSVMIDSQASEAALAYSSDLVKGHWWRTLGRILFVGILIGILSQVTTGLAASSPLVLYALISAVVGAFTGPYFSIALTLAFFDLKLRQAEAGDHPS